MVRLHMFLRVFGILAAVGGAGRLVGVINDGTLLSVVLHAAGCVRAVRVAGLETPGSSRPQQHQSDQHQRDGHPHQTGQAPTA